jgi:hypothetical protein
MKKFIFIIAPICICCTKQIEHKTNAPVDTPTGKLSPTDKPSADRKPTTPTTTTFKTYSIQAGAHNCDQSVLKSVSGTLMNFTAKFDNTAIYPAVITDYNHAYDVKKLYGFSEGLNNQYNSARIGWRWLDGQLQLFAYVYVKGTLLRDPISYDPPFIKSVAIGSEINCSIKISGGSYIFTVDGVVVTTARGTTSGTYNGYQQYPYFGGTLTAPHLINIYIK